MSTSDCMRYCYDQFADKGLFGLLTILLLALVFFVLLRPRTVAKWLQVEHNDVTPPK